MESISNGSFLKSDYDSDLIGPRTTIPRIYPFSNFDRQENGLSIPLDFGNGLDDRISRSWEEPKGAWPLELGSSPKREEQIVELSKSLVYEKKKRRALEDLLSKKEKQISKLLDERKVLKLQIGEASSTPPPSPQIAIPVLARSQSSNTIEEDEEMTYLEWTKTKVQLQDQFRALQIEMEKKEARLTELELECKRNSLLNWRTTNEKLKQDVDMEVWRRKFNELQQQQGEREDLIKKKDKEIEFLRSELQLKNDENYKMALKLLDYKSKVSAVELQLRKWPVKKIHKLYPNVDVEIVLTKNPSNGVLSIDVLERGKHNLRSLKGVELVQGIDNRFNILYKDNGIDTFESENTVEIVDSIDEVLA